MKTHLTFLLACGFMAASAQTKLDKSIPVKSGQRVQVHFDYPKIIRVSTWEGNTVAIQASVSINDGESDDAFVLDINPSNDVIDIRGRIKDMDDLPHRITVMKDGVKTIFKNEAEWKKYRKENGKGNYDMVNQGLDIEITIDIKVPAKVATNVVSVYGMVEVMQFNGPLHVEATYGGVDAQITESTTGELVAETNYGHIYSDLTMRFDKGRTSEEDFHTVVAARNGNGNAYRFESPYGNVYLRKSK